MDTKYSSIREVAKRYAELAGGDEQKERRRKWARHNSLQFSGPLIYMRAVPYHEFFDYGAVGCQDPLLRRLECEMAEKVLYHNSLKDDSVYDPWLVIGARFYDEEAPKWGAPCGLSDKPVPYGAAAYSPTIREEADLEKLKPAGKTIDERATAEDYEKVADAVGDIINVVVDRQGVFCGMWANDISTDLAKLRGLEQIMWDAYDRPDFLHALVGKMQRAILEDMDRTERAGGFALFNSRNQAMPFALELEPPDDCTFGVSTDRLWGYIAAQEFTTFGPALFDEFMLSYQAPILERFGLAAYGCCEDLTKKIPLLKKRLKNLRRIAVSPYARVRECAELIGKDYVLSYRPNPATVARGLDESAIMDTLIGDFSVMKEYGCIFDVTLKDVETVSADPRILTRWVELVRKAESKVYG